MEIVEKLCDEILKLRNERQAAHSDYEKIAQTYLNGKIDGMEKAFEMIVGCSVNEYFWSKQKGK